MVDDASGIVVNVIEWDGEEATWRAPTGYTMVLDEPPSAGPGFSYENGKFIPPPSGEVGTATVEETAAAKPAPKKRK
jgi:hypothetical protein